MPKEAKVFIVDDYESIRAVLKAWLNLEGEGHQVVLEASSLEEAIEKIEDGQAEEVDVAIIDGSLSPGVNTTDDGRVVAEALRRKVPKVKIISHSTLEADWGDIDFRKGSRSLKELVQIVTTL